MLTMIEYKAKTNYYSIYPIYEDDFENMIYVVIDSLDNFLLQWKREQTKMVIKTLL